MSNNIILNLTIIIIFIVIITIIFSLLFRYINERFSKIRSQYILHRDEHIHSRMNEYE